MSIKIEWSTSFEFGTGSMQLNDTWGNSMTGDEHVEDPMRILDGTDNSPKFFPKMVTREPGVYTPDRKEYSGGL